MLAAMRTFLILCLAASASSAQDAQALFTKHCAGCHQAGGEIRAQLPSALKLLSKEKILAALELGMMKAPAAALTSDERLALAAHVSGGAGMEPQAQTGACPAAKFGMSPGEAGWPGWGVDAANSRFQSAKAAGLDREKVARLKLKWAFGFAGQSQAMAQPVIAGGRLFLGSADGTVYSLDGRTGCPYWTYKAPAMVRTAISLESLGPNRYALYFGDVKANVYALDAETGAEIWRLQADPHPFARITGAPALAGRRLYVPVSSIEEVPPANVKYPCCSF